MEHSVLTPALKIKVKSSRLQQRSNDARMIEINMFDPAIFKARIACFACLPKELHSIDHHAPKKRIVEDGLPITQSPHRPKLVTIYHPL